MRVNITVDIDGTDGQQEQALDIFEAACEEHQVFWIKDMASPGIFEASYVAVTEVPERSVRGPAKQAL